jgi:molybdopterin molybdotransferase
MAADAKPQSKTPLTVEQALERMLSGVTPSTRTTRVDLLSAPGAVLVAPLTAKFTQPPFDASAMDGYAVRAADITTLPTTLRVVGESAAGHGYGKTVALGEAVRIFTGAPMPPGADAVVIQENTEARPGTVTVVSGLADIEHIRPRGGDFSAGATLVPAGRLLTARDVTLAAAGGHSHLDVRQPPVVAILATGDELVAPGETPAADQIICSNPYGVAAMVRVAGGIPQLLGIARDNRASLEEKIAEARHADILVTLGGASVGDHDLVGPVLAAHGMELTFWKIAMRPGKPLMFGNLGNQRVLGLPGNPVSSIITARIFLVPLIRTLLGLPTEKLPEATARLEAPLAANGPRAHYMRALRQTCSDGTISVRPLPSQDSSLLVPLAAADCLIVRPIAAPAVPVGTDIRVVPLDC